MNELGALERALREEEHEEITRRFVDAPRPLRATGPVPPGRLVVDDRRSAGAWMVLADGPCVLDAASGLEHAPAGRAAAYAEGRADLSGATSRPEPERAPASTPTGESTPEAATRGVWLPADGAPRVHPGFGEAALGWLQRGALRGSSAPGEERSRVRRVGPADDRARILEQILALEAEVYEPARQDPPEKLRKAFDDPDGVAVLAEREEAGQWRLVGFSLGVPLEKVAEVEGAREDPGFGRHDTLYALTTTLSPAARGLGLGLAVKQESIRAAAALRRADGEPRYHWISGRNRIGATAAMTRINRRLGADVLRVLENQYGGEGRAAWYRMPVGAPVPGEADERDGPIDLGEVRRLLARPPASHRALERAGGLYGPWMSPVEPSPRWTTAAIERTRRAFAALSPALPHVAFARSFEALRPEATRLVGVADETHTAGWRGTAERFFLAEVPRAILWRPRPGLVALHTAEPLADAGGDPLTLVRALHDLFALASAERGPSPLEPAFLGHGFAGGEAAGEAGGLQGGSRRFFRRPMGSEGAALAAAERATERGIRLGVEDTAVFAALPWDLDDDERTAIEEMLRTVFA